MQVMTEKTMTSSVTEVFPCSSGTEHHTKEVQGTSVGTFETPAPPQVSGFSLKSIYHHTLLLYMYRAPFEGSGGSPPPS